jgi:hypothetical protein
MARNRERTEITMNMIKKMLISAVVTTGLLLSVVACEKKSDKPVVEQSNKETKSNEHPKNEHPSNEETSNNHPSGKK